MEPLRSPSGSGSTTIRKRKKIAQPGPVPRSEAGAKTSGPSGATIPWKAGAKPSELSGAKVPKKSSVKVEFRRDLGLLDIVMIGIGAMIGAGIFVLSGIAAGLAGPACILAFLFNGIINIITGMTYAELGAAYPEAGGGYLWVKKGLPPPS